MAERSEVPDPPDGAAAERGSADAVPPVPSDPDAVAPTIDAPKAADQQPMLFTAGPSAPATPPRRGPKLPRRRRSSTGSGEGAAPPSPAGEPMLILDPDATDDLELTPDPMALVVPAADDRAGSGDGTGGDRSEDSTGRSEGTGDDGADDTAEAAGGDNGSRVSMGGARSRLILPVLLLIAALAAFATAESDDVTAVQTDVLVVSTSTTSTSAPTTSIVARLDSLAAPAAPTVADADATTSEAATATHSVATSSTRPATTTRATTRAHTTTRRTTTRRATTRRTTRRATTSTTAATSSTTTGTGGTGSSTTAGGTGSSTTGTGSTTTGTGGTGTTTGTGSTTTTDGSTSSTAAGATTTDPGSTTVPPTTDPSTTGPSTTGPSTTLPPCTGDDAFQLVYTDDFDAPGLDPTWSRVEAEGNGGFGQLRPEAVSISGGRLFITAEMVDGVLVSGAVLHQHPQTYGRYVVRVRTDTDLSQSVSGIVLTAPVSADPDLDGANHLYETPVEDADRNPFRSLIRGPDGQSSATSHAAEGSSYQTMTMDWTPDGITIQREGPGDDAETETWTLTETADDLVSDVDHRLAIRVDAWKPSMSGVVRIEVDRVEIHRWCGGDAGNG